MNKQPSLSDEQAIELLNDNNLVSQPIAVKRIGEGSESQVWTVNDEWILRVHSSQEQDEVLNRENCLLDLLRTTSISEAVNPCVWTKYSPRGGWRCGLYTKARGRSIEADSASVTDKTESDLVNFLQCLKDLNVSDVEALGIQDAQPVGMQNLRTDTSNAWALVRNNGALDDIRTLDIGRCLETHGGCPNHARVLLHGDLKGEHLFTTSDGHLSGVIDWTDACIGSPSIDIEGIAISVGASMAARVGLKAGYVKSLVEYGIFLARCNTVLRLARRLRGEDDSPIDLLRIQLRRAFQEYE